MDPLERCLLTIRKMAMFTRKLNFKIDIDIQYWHFVLRKSDGFFVNAGHCEVLDVAYANKEVGIWFIIQILLFSFRMMLWLPFGQSMIRVIRSGRQSLSGWQKAFGGSNEI